MNKLCIFLLTLMLLLSGCTKSSVGNGEDPLGDDVKNAEVGDVITFGSYEQDDNTSDGKEPIEWIVIDKVYGRLLVISKYGLDVQPYNSISKDVTWETCTLRKWLNTTFVNEAFNKQEQSLIATTKVKAEKNPKHDTDPGNDTEDKIFLLSIQEANTYFIYDENRQVKATDYAKENGAYVDNGYSWWWLRSPGSYSFGTAIVDNDGSIDYYGRDVSRDISVVRPAFWLEIDN